MIMCSEVSLNSVIPFTVFTSKFEILPILPIFYSQNVFSVSVKFLALLIFSAVVIDGVEYPGIKFVSVLPQWATHVKNFPIQVLSADGEGSAYREPVPQSVPGGTPPYVSTGSQPIPVPNSTPLLGTRMAQTISLG